MSENIENPNFRPKAIAELLDGKHNFFIPCYQRGYRWDKKQVEDLLKDIYDFGENNNGTFYCLQPLVVKKNPENTEQWIVIDGQQRLTTLLLLLDYIICISSTPFVRKAKDNLYKIFYETRTELDLTNPNPEADIDSFYLHQTKQFIKDWFEQEEEDIDPCRFANVLIKKDEKFPVKFLWYVVENDDEIESINIFNNLNDGKIQLTNAELIKALFVLKTKDQKDELDLYAFAYEWNEIENRLHDDKIWYFLAHKDYNPDTRIDLIFDILTQKALDKEQNYKEDFSYRRFQELYDGNIKDSSIWKMNHIDSFTKAWDKTKEVYQTFVYWYEDNTIYHYIGYLICCGVSVDCIYNQCKGKCKTDVVNELREMIKKEITNKILKKEEINSIEDIRELNYEDHRTELRQLLLLFNIETCVRHTNSEYRFSFEKYKRYDWDIEHVDSRAEKDFRGPKDQIIWLSYLESIYFDHQNWKKIKQDAAILLRELNEGKRVEGRDFGDIYKDVLDIYQSTGSETKAVSMNKDCINNLTLLDAGTNRGYGNALFPTKRQEIIRRDQEGVFIPICTKNLFLKYYTTKDTETSTWKNKWMETDAQAYFNAICDTLKWILIKNNNI